MFLLALLSPPPVLPTSTAFKKVASALILQMACEYLQQCSCRSHRGLLEGMVGASHNLSTTLACSPHKSQQRKGERGSQLPGSRHPDFRHILTAVVLQHPAEKVTFLFEMLFSNILLIRKVFILICSHRMIGFIRDEFAVG